MSTYLMIGTISLGVFWFIGLLVASYTVIKIVQGDISYKEAARVWIPFGCLLAAAQAAGPNLLPPFFLVIAVGYLVWLLRQQQQALAAHANEVVDRDVRKWKDALLQNDKNAFAHLYLGNALVEARQYEQALVHYRRALSLEPKCARELDLFLGGRSRGEERRLRSHLPDLDEVKRSIRPGASTGVPPR